MMLRFALRLTAPTRQLPENNVPEPPRESLQMQVVNQRDRGEVEPGGWFAMQIEQEPHNGLIKVAD